MALGRRFSTRRPGRRGPAITFVTCGTLPMTRPTPRARSEEHTSELQSLRHLVCRLLLESYGDNRDLHSSPTRRSSDLTRRPGRRGPAITFVTCGTLPMTRPTPRA